MDIERFRTEMTVGVPVSVVHASIELAERQGLRIVRPWAARVRASSRCSKSFPTILSNPGTPVTMLLEFHA